MKGKIFTGTCTLMAGNEVIRQFVYTTRVERKKKLAEWDKDVKRLKNSKRYHIVIKPNVRIKWQE